MPRSPRSGSTPPAGRGAAPRSSACSPWRRRPPTRRRGCPPRSPADAFLVGLAGEIESDPALGHAIAELQAPSTSPRPALHLVAAMRAELFGVDGVDALADHRLVAEGVLAIDGDEPLPLRALAIDPRLWALLRGRLDSWPGTRAIDERAADALPRGAAGEAAAIAQLLAGGAASGIALRGPAMSGRAAFAALIARQLGRRPVETTADGARADRAFGAAASYGLLLPVIRLDPPAGEATPSPRPTGYAGPLALLLARGGAVADERLVELAPPRFALAERAEA